MFEAARHGFQVVSLFPLAMILVCVFHDFFEQKSKSIFFLLKFGISTEIRNDVQA